MPIESHLLMDGALHVYRRENSRFWQCATYLGSRNYRQTTKEESLAAAKDFARDWYMERCVEDRQRRRGGALLLDGPVQPPPPQSPRPRAPPPGAAHGERQPARVSRTPPLRSPASSRSSPWVSATLAMLSKSQNTFAFISCPSSAIPRLRTSRRARFRNIGFTARHRGSIRKPASRRSPRGPRFMVKSSHCGRC